MYVGIMGMTRAVWVGQARVWVGHGLPGLIARTASAFIMQRTSNLQFNNSSEKDNFDKMPC